MNTKHKHRHAHVCVHFHTQTHMHMPVSDWCGDVFLLLQVWLHTIHIHQHLFFSFLLHCVIPAFLSSWRSSEKRTSMKWVICGHSTTKPSQPCRDLGQVFQMSWQISTMHLCRNTTFCERTMMTLESATPTWWPSTPQHAVNWRPWVIFANRWRCFVFHLVDTNT